MRRLFRAIDRGVEYGVALLFAAMCLVGLLQVFNRFVLNRSLSWSEEYQIFSHVWIVFLAIPIAYRRGAHLSMDSLKALLPSPARKLFDVCVELLWLWFAASLAWLAWRVSQVARLQSSPGLELPMNWVYYSMVAGGLYLLLLLVRKLLLKEEFA